MHSVGFNSFIWSKDKSPSRQLSELKPEQVNLGLEKEKEAGMGYYALHLRRLGSLDTHSPWRQGLSQW